MTRFDVGDRVQVKRAFPPGHRRTPHYIRGKLVHGKFTPVGRQESHALFGLSQSNALLRVAPGSGLKAGALVDVEIWD